MKPQKAIAVVPDLRQPVIDLSELNAALAEGWTFVASITNSNPPMVIILNPPEDAPATP